MKGFTVSGTYQDVLQGCSEQDGVLFVHGQIKKQTKEGAGEHWILIEELQEAGLQDCFIIKTV